MTRSIRSAVVLACAAMVIGACENSRGPAGIVITNVRIIDGTGTPARAGAVRIVGDTIDAVGEVTPSKADSIVDGKGLVLAPGFIDTHSHHASGLKESPDGVAVVSQGITTIVAGQDGSHPMPLKAAMDSMTASPVAPNVAWYAGHGTIRDAVMGDDFKRVATAKEVDSMSVLLQHELDAGALGLSSGLEYDPGINSDRAEVLALAKVAAKSGGRYISHIRSEDRWFWEAIDEIITIGRDAKLPVQVSHIKLGMIPLWGQTDSLLHLLDKARADGVDITADVYPYPYWQSTLTVLFPKRDFDNRAEAEKILREIAKPEGLLIGTFAANAEYQGKTVAEIAVMRHEDAASTLMGLIRESIAWKASKKGTADSNATSESVVATSMSDADVAKLIAWPFANISSDGSMNGAHPRGFGTFPRVLGRYVREQHVLSLEEAIRKMTSLSAAHVGITKRGTIVKGGFADLVLFDPNTIIDNSTPKDPHLVSTGVVGVWVNGKRVWENGKATGVHPGRVIRR